MHDPRSAPPASPSEVPSPEVLPLLEQGSVYLDVRTVEEFAQGHVPGAYNVPWRLGTLAGMIDNQNFAETVERCFDKSRLIVLGCRSGRRAKDAAEAMSALGYRQLLVHADSWEGSKDAFGRTSASWTALGLPVETSTSPGRSYAELRSEAGDS